MAPLNALIDDDLSNMYLSDKKKGIPRAIQDHDELEVLLESFSKQVEEIVNEAENTQVWVLSACLFKYVSRVMIDQCTINTRNCGAYSRLQSQCTLGLRSQGDS